MILLDIIEVFPDDIPYKQEVVIGNTSHILQFGHNTVSDTVEVDLFDTSGALIHGGETLVYGMPLWYPFIGQPGYPTVYITPASVDGIECPINLSTLGAQIQLTITDA